MTLPLALLSGAFRRYQEPSRDMHILCTVTSSAATIIMNFMLLKPGFNQVLKPGFSS
jgi:hypothetical protein